MPVKAGAVLVLAVVLCAGCGSETKVHFQSANGWHLLSSKGALAAANTDFDAHDLGSHPSRTVESLPSSGIVIWGMYLHDGNGHYPRRQLPLRVEQGNPSNPFEGFRCAPAVTTSNCYAASGSIQHLQARAGSYGVDLYVFFGTDHPLPEQVAAADAELARLRLPHARTSPTPQAASCPHPTDTGSYDTRVSPSSGPAGTTVTVSGRLPVLSESGREIGQTATEVVAYWNLDLDRWTSIATARPVAAVARSPVRFLGTENVAGRCTYRARLTIPQARPGTYPIDVLYGDPHGGASFAPAVFRVTEG